MGALFDKWCATSKFEDFKSLKELILLEDFNRRTPERCVVTIFADEFALIQKEFFFSPHSKGTAPSVGWSANGGRAQSKNSS